MLPYLTGEVKESPRQFFFYMSDDGDILGIRMKDWKVVLMEQRAKQLMCWFEPFVKLQGAEAVQPAARSVRARRREFEHVLGLVYRTVYIIYAMQAIVAGQIENFQKFPPRQKPASFNLDAVMRTLEEAHSSAGH